MVVDAEDGSGGLAEVRWDGGEGSSVGTEIVDGRSHLRIEISF
jgi:hypothetical protein